LADPDDKVLIRVELHRGFFNGVGILIATTWSDRCAYRDTAGVSTCVDAQFRGRGIGRQSMQAIDAHAQRLGFHALIAGISEGKSILTPTPGRTYGGTAR
jgi:L-amino acid N-acyltransferase YncA